MQLHGFDNISLRGFTNISNTNIPKRANEFAYRVANLAFYFTLLLAANMIWCIHLSNHIAITWHDGIRKKRQQRHLKMVGSRSGEESKCLKIDSLTSLQSKSFLSQLPWQQKPQLFYRNDKVNVCKMVSNKPFITQNARQVSKKEKKIWLSKWQLI